MKTLALYGFAEATREGVWQSQADEIWSVVWAYKYNIPRLDRLFEMHPIWYQARSEKPEYVKARDHWDWLKQNQSIPVYMLVNHPEVPRCIRYPIEEVQSMLPPKRREAVFTSSFDYMMALALMEGWERIELYGFEMGSDTEYRYQREGASYWLAQADARGVEVVLPENTALLRKKMYGYKGGSMIYRQDLERLLRTREQHKVEEFARLSYLRGEMQNVVEQYGQNSPEALEVINRWDRQYRLCFLVDGAVQTLEYLLKEIDLEEPSEELIDPYHVIPVRE